MQIVSSGDNLHEMAKPVKKNIQNMLSAENCTQSVKRQRFLHLQYQFSEFITQNIVRKKKLSVVRRVRELSRKYE